ncbi:MAG: methionyl-tRNA formyltransferase [Patescibacteria group bacterium]|jgi:methionyl-tRNA formyltransferase|nr:methionyl-tRNA formyltransferase [Patescibacteria group bacterium]
MEKLPYILFGSAPIGPIALKALQMADYPPVAVIDDPKMSVEDQIAIIEQHEPTFLLVVGYGAILKRDVLDTVAGQVLNIHPSLLPEYRGPAPVVQALLDGVTETGVTLIEIDTKMDHGPILAQDTLRLRGNELPEEVYQLLTTRGVSLFLEHIDDYLTEEADLIPQNDFDATFTHFVKKEDGRLDFSKPAEVLEREIRAYHGWPRSFTTFKGKRLIIEKARLEGGELVVEQVQPENGKIMTIKEFCAGQRMTQEAFYEELRNQ